PVDLTWYDGLQNLPPLPEGYGTSKAAANVPTTNQGPVKQPTLSPGRIIYSKDLTFKGGSHGSTLSIIPEDIAKEMAAQLPEVPESSSNHFANFILACQVLVNTRSHFE